MQETSSANSSIIASKLILKLNELFKEKPDAIVLFGDRFEICLLQMFVFYTKFQ